MKNLCLLCSLRVQGCGCCVNDDVVVTSGDVQRIEKEIGISGFYEHRALNREGSGLSDPLWYRFVQGPGGARVLRRTTNGCCFLGSSGCKLSGEARPLVCRLYPYDLFTETTLDDPWIETVCCPEEFLFGRSLLERVGIVKSDAVLWHKQLYEEIRLELAERAEK